MKIFKWLGRDKQYRKTICFWIFFRIHLYIFVAGSSVMFACSTWKHNTKKWARDEANCRARLAGLDPQNSKKICGMLWKEISFFTEAKLSALPPLLKVVATPSKIVFYYVISLFSDTTQCYRTQVANVTWRVRFTAGADRIWQIYRVAADSKSASSLRSLPQLLLNFLFRVNKTFRIQIKSWLTLYTKKSCQV